jgi:hypothetical protein
MFDHQCLDPTARLIRERLVTDPSWDHDQNGLLVRRLETGETSLHVPASLQQPCAVIHAFPEVKVSPALTASSLPVATDGSVLIRGVKDGKSTENSFATTFTSTRPVLHILTRSPIPRQLLTSVGLALVTVPDEAYAIPTGAETGVGAISSSELRVAQATDPDCQRFL